jgi:hypothetical protein
VVAPGELERSSHKTNLIEIAQRER